MRSRGWWAGASSDRGTQMTGPPPFRRVAIVGMGLIGGSIALALRRAWPGLALTAIARQEETVDTALRLGMAQTGSTSLEAAAGADLVMVCLPVGSMAPTFGTLGALDPAPALVTDAGSVKGAVLEAARALGPVPFVGGHPMAGLEVSGLEHARADLFERATWVLTPSTGDAGAVAAVSELVRGCGASPLVMDASTHDDWVAATSHLAFLVSAAYTDLVTGSGDWSGMQALTAGGFRDMSRLAAGNPQMYREICEGNRAAILSWMDRFADSLAGVRRLVASGGPGLEDRFDELGRRRTEWERSR
ncbi:MAG: prephenate dehydrogenase [Candidatus Dormibacteria bacterium]